MTDNEIVVLYHGLTESIRNAGLGWLVTAVERSIREGNIVRSTEFDEGFLVPVGNRHRGRAPERNVFRPLTAGERLRLLIEAIDSAVCGPVYVLHELFQRLPEAADQTIALATDQVDSEDAEFTIKDVLARRDAAEGLRRALNEIREALSAH